jgi:hypothetical protein
MKTFITCICLFLAIAALAQSAPVKLKISDGMIEAVNTSAQPIVEIEVQVVGRTAGVGNLVFHSNHDFFFKTPLAPGAIWEVVHYLKENVPYQASGETIVLGPDSKPILDEQGNPKLVPVKTEATFVQYADGSTWGTPNERTVASMAKRHDRLVAAHAWLAAYRNGGLTAFSQALAGEPKFKAEAAMIQNQVKLGGEESAVKLLESKLATADALMATGKF